MQSLDFSSLNLRDLTLVGGASAVLYMMNGAYAQIICNVLTGIVPAFFTYRMILEPISTRTGYHAVLFYWLLHGCLSASDQFCADSSGYFFGKFALLGLVFGHAIYQNNEIYEVVVKKYQQAESVYVETTECTQMPTRHHTLLANIEPLVTSTAHSITESAINLASPTPTAFSDRSGYGMADQQGVIEYNDNFVDNIEAVKKYYNSTVIGASSTSEFVSEANSTDDQYIVPTPDQDTLTAKNCYNNSIIEKKLEMIEDREPMSYVINTPAGDDQSFSQQTIELAYGDIVTNPMSEVVFKSRNPGEKSLITLTNVSNMNIMWALKTNALNRIHAGPVCGTIERGRTVEIKLAIMDSSNFKDDVHYKDKIAIDYILLEDDGPFEAKFFGRDDKRRHRLHVTYASA